MVRESWPVWLRFVFAGGLLVFGPGAAIAARWLAPLPGLTRAVLSFGFGLALGPVLAQLLASVGAIELYPYLAAALAGGAIGHWYRQSGSPRRPSWAPLGLAALALAMAVTAFSHRLSTSGGVTVVYGSYDTYDLTYYAAIGAELSHTIPPASPFFSGRMLNHGFYPHVLPGLIHRFGAVPIFDLYLRYLWPAFLVLAVLLCFVLVESIAGRLAAVLSAVLFAAGSNLAYLAAWLLPIGIWDDVVWSHNLQGAGAEVLFYGNWTPALAIVFAGLYALHAGLQSSRLAWAVLAGATLGVSVLSKPWFFAMFAAALPIVAITCRRDRDVTRRLLIAAGSAIAVATPLLYRAYSLREDAQVTFAPAFLSIPLVMADRVGLRGWFMDRAAMLTADAAAQTAIAALFALPLFLAGTMGFRLVGLGLFWRALRHPAREAPIWRLLAWATVAAFLAASVVVSVPYHETTQIHQSALFLLTLFAGRAIASVARARDRAVAAAVVIAIAVPGTVQYLHRKWEDRARPLAVLTAGEQALAALLRATDPEQTVILHDRPDGPALLPIVAARRSVLAAPAGYVRGSERRRADVEAFFAGTDADRARAILRTYRPTHVVEYADRDRINPEIRDQLVLAGRASSVSLYRVPDHLAAGER